MPNRVERHKRRAAGYGYSGEHFSEEDWRALVEICGGACLSCGSTEGLSVDHVIPLSLGGPNSVDNLQLLCRECNSLKGSAIVDYRLGRVVL